MQSIKRFTLFTCILGMAALPALVHASGLMYAANYNDNSYTKCNMVNDKPVGCTKVFIKDSSGQNMLSGPSDIAFYDSYVYITNQTSNSYTQCHVENDNIDLTTCNTYKPSGKGALSAPSSIKFSGTEVYITNIKNNTYTQCNVQENGIDPNSCTTVHPYKAESQLLSYPAAITIIG